MKVSDAMTKNPISCTPGTNVAAAAELMWTNDCGVLPVLDDAGQVAGIVSDRDLLIAVGTKNVRPGDLMVGEVMKSPVTTCKPGDDVDSVLSTMRAQKIRRLPVVDDEGALAGILCMNDIVLHSDRKAREGVLAYDDVMAAIKGICAHGQVARQAGAAA